MVGRRALLIVSVSLATTLILVAAAWGKVTTQTGSSSSVNATFTFSGSAPMITNPQLTIVRGGQQLYSQPVYSHLCGHQCGPGAFGAHQSSVRVLDIEGNGEPDVILELFSGGASCCFLDQVFSFDPGTMTYVKTEHDFNYGVVLEKLDGRWLFRSGDGSFLCAFTDCADSGQPIQLSSFKGQRFHDVTRHYPKQIRRDAARWLRLFEQHLSNGVGLIAAWAADEELLGKNALVQSTLSSQARKGDLRDGMLGAATGKRFIVDLNRLLRRLGYEQ